MGYKPNHKRIKPKRVKPTAKQKQFHLWAMSEYDCIGCGAPSTVVHHPLMESPLQNGRRDHDFICPMCSPCHEKLHQKYGNEANWAADYGGKLPVRQAEDVRCHAKAVGVL